MFFAFTIVISFIGSVKLSCKKFIVNVTQIYFSSGYVGEVFTHPISVKIPITLCKCLTIHEVNIRLSSLCVGNQGHQK